MVWYGKEAAVKIGDALTTVSTAETLWAQVTGTDYSAECKELTINPGEAGIDVLNVYGDQLLEESRPELVTAEFTMVFTDVDIWGMSFGTATGPSGYTRYQGQDKTGSRTAKAIVFKLASSTKGTLHALMNNAYITAMGEMTLAADGSAEQTFTAVCKLSDFYVEYASP